MSKFFSKKFQNLTPYVPGEQPRQKFIKLNTNESPFPPSPIAQNLARQAAGDLRLYSDPDARSLAEVACEIFNVSRDQITFTNGSDEGLNFAFTAFCDDKTSAVFADVTYGFYKVFAEYNRVSYKEIPLKDDFSLDVTAFLNVNATVFIANPNAQTGVLTPIEDIEKIVASNPRNVVIVDEAYIDFGGDSAVKLIDKYDNLLVVGTFSKSRSLAGARLGYVIGNAELLADVETLRYSTNPYNVNRMTQAAGIGALLDKKYFERNCNIIKENRAYLSSELDRLGFESLPSSANFILARHNEKSGKEIYEELKKRGILVRRFDMPRIQDHIRITIGTLEDMQALVKALEEIL